METDSSLISFFFIKKKKATSKTLLTTTPIQTVSRDTGAELIFLKETRVQSLELAVEWQGRLQVGSTADTCWTGKYNFSVINNCTMDRLSIGVVYGSTVYHTIHNTTHLMKMRGYLRSIIGFGWWWSKLPGNFRLRFVKFQETIALCEVQTAAWSDWPWWAWVGLETHQEFRLRYGCTASLKTAKASSTHRQDRTHQIVLALSSCWAVK